MLLPTDWLERPMTWTRAKSSVTPTTPDGQYGYQWWFNAVDPNRPGAAAVNQAESTDRPSRSTRLRNS